MRAHTYTREVTMERVSKEVIDEWIAMIRVVEDAVRAVEKSLSANHGLCLAAYEILRVLDGCVEPVQLNVVVKAVSRSQSRVSRLVSQMVGEGYLRREGDPSDARSSNLTIAESGKQVLKESDHTVGAVLAELNLPMRFEGSLRFGAY